MYKQIGPFQGEYRWLSNFWPVEIWYDGMKYSSVEHAYQAAKTLDTVSRHQIQIASTPSQAKRLGKRVNVREDWDELKLYVMVCLLRQKFRDPVLKMNLIHTQDAYLVELNTWGDRFWGVCDGHGHNHLGRLLMKIRKELRDGD